jgi:hypothetical protein
VTPHTVAGASGRRHTPAAYPLFPTVPRQRRGVVLANGQLHYRLAGIV